MARWALYTPCGLMLLKELLIDRVDCSKIIHILQKDLGDLVSTPRPQSVGLLYRRLDDFPDLAPASLNNTFQILERLASLCFDPAIDNSASLGIEAEAP